MLLEQVVVLELGGLPQVDLGGEPPLGQLGEAHVPLTGVDPHASQAVGLEHGQPAAGFGLGGERVRGGAEPTGGRVGECCAGTTGRQGRGRRRRPAG